MATHLRGGVGASFLSPVFWVLDVTSSFFVERVPFHLLQAKPSAVFLSPGEIPHPFLLPGDRLLVLQVCLLVKALLLDVFPSHCIEKGASAPKKIHTGSHARTLPAVVS